VNILILNRIGLRHIPYADFLKGDRVFVITDANAVSDLEVARTIFERLECVDQYERGGRVEQLAIAMHREIKFDRIVAVSEFDLLRAARLRDHLGIAGQNYESALAFRDKVRMKQLLAAGGIAVPKFRLVETPLDLLTFIEEHGFGVVLKPVLGAGAVQTYVIRNQSDLDRVLDAGIFSADARSSLEVETFVPGPMYHVDGIVQDGKIVVLWPSMYHNAVSDFAHGTYLGSNTLAADHPLVARLCAFVEKVLAVLPTPSVTGVHAELFHTPDDELVLCEVASRVGGPRIPDTFETALGFDLVRSIVRLQAGHALEVPATPLQPSCVAGFLFVPARKGFLKSAPETCALPGVIDYRLCGEIATEHYGPMDSVDPLASFLLRADSEAELRNAVDRAVDWFDASVEWTPA
jgi:biotin carboxylase